MPDFSELLEPSLQGRRLTLPIWVICRSAIALAPYFLLAIRVPRGRGDSRALSELLQLGQLLRLAKRGKQTPAFN
jgi:hypothetical protein